MKIAEVDPLLSNLSEEYGIPKPNYCIFEVSAMKRLDPLFEDKKYGVKVTRTGGGGYTSIPFGAKFIPEEKTSFITLLVRKKGQIRRENVVHEFFHYLHWVRGKLKIEDLNIKDFKHYFWKLREGKDVNCSIDDITQFYANLHEEELITKKETKKWIRENPLPKKAGFSIKTWCDDCGGDVRAPLYWDEVNKRGWAKCPRCRIIIRELSEDEWNLFVKGMRDWARKEFPEHVKEEVSS